ncbi:MAG: HAD-IA family hydrolase [Gammaproteobacteria bacterium]|nr:HAD-IA family hydrolase [Gammaproteobacteria bacterium]MBQ0838591.1 HAD-IA family hydrolase [Gammaproteobacteria bacterium]
MSRANYQAVLFDLDGTLLDTAPDFTTSINLMLSRHQRPTLSENDIRAIITHGSAGLLSYAFKCSESDAGFETLREEFLNIYCDHLAQKTCLFPGLAELLTALGQHHIPWGIVTNKPRRFTCAILEGLALQPAPQAVVCPDDVEHNKPHAEPVLLACRQLGVAPQHTVFIGDHLRDIESGRNAGTATIAAAYGYIDDAERPHDWGAQYLVNDSRQLYDLLIA